MPNKAEILERLAKESICRKILMTVKDECETLDDVIRYVEALIKELESKQ